MTALAVANAAYVAAALLFIMSLAGLSKHETGRIGIRYGIAGMTIAMSGTIWLTFSGEWNESTSTGFVLLLVQILAFIGVLIASINVFGGFAVTRRMLKMFTKGDQ